MCRMVLAIGRVGDGEVILDLVRSLVRAASMDPYGKEFLDEEQHRDGWGLLIVGVRDSAISMLYHRSVRPIFEDDPVGIVESFLKGFVGTVVMMAHARAASTGTPINLFSTHPVKAVTNSGSELYMIHNGSFNKDLLLKAVDMPSNAAARYNDTYVANLALARRVGDDIDRDDLAWLLNYVRTAANLGITLIGNGRVLFITGSYYRLFNDGREVARERYYRFYNCEVSGLSIYASSTVIDHYRPGQLTNCRALANGEYHKYVLRGNGEVEARQTWLFTQ